MVSCYTEFVLTVTKGGNLQWKHDITAKETLTTYCTSFDKWLMDFRGCFTQYCLHLLLFVIALLWTQINFAFGGGILINPVWHKLYREICKEIFYPYFEPRRERFIEQNCLSSFVKLSQFPQLSISAFHSQQSISKKWLTHEHVSQYSIQ